MTGSLDLTDARAIRDNFLTIPNHGESNIHDLIFNPSLSQSFSIRTPSICGHRSLSHPSGLEQPPVSITEDSPIGYHLINGGLTLPIICRVAVLTRLFSKTGLVVLTPNKDVFKALVVYLRTCPLVATFSFADQDLYAK